MGAAYSAVTMLSVPVRAPVHVIGVCLCVCVAHAGTQACAAQSHQLFDTVKTGAKYGTQAGSFRGALHWTVTSCLVSCSFPAKATNSAKAME